MAVPQIPSRAAALLARFRHDNKANVAVIFALALLPILPAIGCATDYSLATRMKAKMQEAADAAQRPGTGRWRRRQQCLPRQFVRRLRLYRPVGDQHRYQDRVDADLAR